MILLEYWKPISGFTKYECSWSGKIKSFHGRVNIIKESLTSKGYAQLILCENGIRKKTFVHRVVACEFLGIKGPVDHKNRNKSDNSASNLRLCTVAENQYNTASREGSSKFKGVSYYKPTGKWYAQIRIEGKKKSLGYHVKEIDAAAAYDTAAIEAHGDYACLNFNPKPQGGSDE